MNTEFSSTPATSPRKKSRVDTHGGSLELAYREFTNSCAKILVVRQAVSLGGLLAGLIRWASPLTHTPLQSLLQLCPNGSSPQHRQLAIWYRISSPHGYILSVNIEFRQRSNPQRCHVRRSKNCSTFPPTRLRKRESLHSNRHQPTTLIYTDLCEWLTTLLQIAIAKHTFTCNDHFTTSPIFI